MDDGTVLTKCDQCRVMHQERRERGIDSYPPCEECMGDELLENNRDAAMIYNLCQGQVITQHNGMFDRIIDLNYQTVKTMMDLYEVKNQKIVFEKVRRVFFFFLGRQGTG